MQILSNGLSRKNVLSIFSTCGPAYINVRAIRGDLIGDITTDRPSHDGGGHDLFGGTASETRATAFFLHFLVLVVKIKCRDSGPESEKNALLVLDKLGPK